ncbi:MNARL protein, partial [Atractosteus spatula]|nr:MNARL protein [Atractosteus spatula]
MDFSVLPNNNHPEKFLQLEVKSLPISPAMAQAGFAAGAALSGHRQWQNRVYLQREKRNLNDSYGWKSTEGSPVLVDKSLGKHITPVTLKSKIKRNPLYSDIRTLDGWESKKTQPSWTIQEYDRHSLHSNLAGYLKVNMILVRLGYDKNNILFQEDPSNLSFWMEDLYTPGYDSLLKKKENELKRNKICKIITLISVLMCIFIVIVTVPIVVTKYRN